LVTILLQGILNIFTTGIFYTGFLTMYGMSITDTGIITVIPYIANLFGIFSGKVLARFKSPKKAILWAKLFYYILFLPGITIMPKTPLMQNYDLKMIPFADGGFKREICLLWASDRKPMPSVQRFIDFARQQHPKK